MKRLLPYLLITLIFAVFIGVWHKGALTYRFDQKLVNDYLRSQDIEDSANVIKDRVILSDSDLYIASGYLYAKGEDPTKYDFQVPAFIKYLFGFSTVLFGNPYYAQIFFGLALLFLTFFLGQKVFQSSPVAFGGTMLLLIDPVFSGMQNEALLDLGLTVFALSYVILTMFYPKKALLSGAVLGLLAASKFWSVAATFAVLIYGYRIFVKKEKLDVKRVLTSFGVAFLAFSLVYTVSFIRAGGDFNIFAYIVRVTRYMLSHNSARLFGGNAILFLTGYFAPWWQSGVLRSDVWSFLWPTGLVSGIILVFRKMVSGVEPFFYFLPVAYLLLTSTQVPFARYFILILPFVYLNLASFLIGIVRK